LNGQDVFRGTGTHTADSQLIHADGEGTFFIDTDCGTTRYDSGDEYRKVFFRAGENKIRIGALRFVPELEEIEIYSALPYDGEPCSDRGFVKIEVLL